MASLESIQAALAAQSVNGGVTPTPSAANIGKDLFAGTVAGLAQVMTGQPFDIVKVRLQSSDAYSSTFNCASRILKEEGPRAFYKGSGMPLVGIGACVSLQFAFLQAGKRFFSERNATQNPGMNVPLSNLQLYLSGAGAGIGNSMISCPVEHIRIRLQTQTAASPVIYKGPIDALKRIYASDGLRGLYQGRTATLAREFHGYGMYFFAYEWLVQRELQGTVGKTRRDLPVSSAIMYGMGAGYAMWLTDYPLDVIKSRMQTDGLPSQAGTPHRKYSSARDCARQLWREQGWKGFFRGLTPTLIRSPFVNGATFAVFEITMRVIS